MEKGSDGQMHPNRKDGAGEPLPVDALLQEVIAQARALGIPVSRSILPHVQINRRATGRFGACFLKKETGFFQIELSDVMLAAPKEICCETLAHEVLHTCYGCMNHKERWRHYAERMNSAYGYRISRTGKAKEMGVREKSAPRYWLVCTKCGREVTRERRSKLVMHPEAYRCKCGGRLKLRQGMEENS